MKREKNKRKQKRRLRRAEQAQQTTEKLDRAPEYEEPNHPVLTAAQAALLRKGQLVTSRKWTGERNPNHKVDMLVG